MLNRTSPKQRCRLCLALQTRPFEAEDLCSLEARTLSALDAMRADTVACVLANSAFPELPPVKRAQRLQHVRDDVLRDVLGWVSRSSASKRANDQTLPSKTQDIVQWAKTRYLQHLIKLARPPNPDDTVAASRTRELQLVGRALSTASPIDRLLLLMTACPHVVRATPRIADEIEALAVDLKAQRILRISDSVARLARAGFAAADPNTLRLEEALVTSEPERAATFGDLVGAVARACGDQTMQAMGVAAVENHRGVLLKGLDSGPTATPPGERFRILAQTLRPSPDHYRIAFAALLKTPFSADVLLRMMRALVLFAEQSADAYTQTMAEQWAAIESATDRLARDAASILSSPPPPDDDSQ